MKLGISENSNEDYLSHRDGLSITRESKSIKTEWTKLNSEEELEEWHENTQSLEGVHLKSEVFLKSWDHCINRRLENGVQSWLSIRRCYWKIFRGRRLKTNLRRKKVEIRLCFDTNRIMGFSLWFFDLTLKDRDDLKS